MAHKASGAPVDFLVEPVLFQFKNWRIIANNFPYDAAFEQHHLLVPNRTVANRSELNEAELEELETLMRYGASLDYDCMMENFPRNRTVPGHFHIHLLNYKEMV